MATTENYGNQLAEATSIYHSLADNGQTDLAQTVGNTMSTLISNVMTTQSSVTESGS